MMIARWRRAILMIVFTLALVAKSTQLSTISEVMLSGHVGLRISLGPCSSA